MIISEPHNCVNLTGVNSILDLGGKLYYFEMLLFYKVTLS